MDGFVATAESAQQGCIDPDNPNCQVGPIDVMGYHTADRDIPNYWSYAQNFVLQDRMFEPVASWSLPAHLFQVSEWSATCTRRNDPSSCRTRSRRPGRSRRTNATKHPAGSPGTPIYAWTDLTYLLHKQNVSWGYYVVTGTEPDCAERRGASRASPASRTRRRPASGTRCRTSTPSATTSSSATSSRSTNFYKAAQERHAARGLVGRPVGRR